MFLARKISRAKWDPKSGLSPDEISADAVTGDLRTQGNSLSFWQCGIGEKDEVEEAVLAIAAAGERIDRFDVVWLADDELRADGQALKDTKGKTPVTDLVDSHVDVCRLDYVRLGKVARNVVTAIEENRYLRLTKARVTKLLASAVTDKRVALDDLNGRIQMEVRKWLLAGR